MLVVISIFNRCVICCIKLSEEPLGQVTIPLDTIDSKGAQMDRWYTLELAGRMKTVSGELHLRLNFSAPPTTETSFEEMVVADAGDDPEPAEFADEPPNELHITVIQGKRLPVMDKPLFGAGSADPRVRIKIDGYDVKTTKYISKNLNPQWNEKIVYQKIHDPSLSMMVIVEDHDTLRYKFMGKVTISLFG